MKRVLLFIFLVEGGGFSAKILPGAGKNFSRQVDGFSGDNCKGNSDR